MTSDQSESTAKTITELVHAHTISFPDAPLLTWIDAHGREEAHYTYQSFDQAARRVASFLISKGIKRGETVILAYAPGVDFFTAFWGCMISGIIAVPVVPPFTQSDVKKFLRIVDDANARVILMDKMIMRIMNLKIRKDQAVQFGKKVASFVSSESSTKQVSFADLDDRWKLNTSDLKNPIIKDLQPHRSSDTAFLMYSSGTTGHPKGAKTTFENIWHQMEMNRLAVGSDSSSISCWWAPHYHDYGLISGFFNVLYAGCRAICTSPMHFIQRPALWLDMLHKYRATHTFGPDFAYLLLLKKTTPQERSSGKWDLRHLKIAMSAAEKVRFATLKSFHKAFAPSGFRWEMFTPAYGLAEHTVGVTIKAYGEPPKCIHVVRSALEQLGQVYVVDKNDPSTNPTGARTVSLVGSGVPHNNTDVQIIQLDEEGEPLKVLNTDRVGEIWVNSKSKTAGYHNLPARSKTAFEARLPNSKSKTLYLRTGDLGFFSSETGELFVCGRQKEMIIVAGKNHFSEDLELTIAEKAGTMVRPGRIAAVSIDDESIQKEVLAIAAEVRNPKDDCMEAIDTIRHCVSTAHKIMVSRVILVPPGALPKTSSGKLRRVQIKRDIIDGSIKPLRNGNWTDTTEIQQGANPADSLMGFLAAREKDQHTEPALLADPSTSIFNLKPILEPRKSNKGKSNRIQIHPVAFSQNAILTYHFLQKQQLSSWNVPFRLWLNGPLSVKHLQQAFLAIHAQHEPLRTTFHMTNQGSFEQWVHPYAAKEFLSVYQAKTEEEALEWAQEASLLPFDVTESVFRAELYRLSSERALLLIVMHHAIADGQTVGLFLRTLAQQYTAAKKEQSQPPKPKTLQFCDYVYWQMSMTQGGFFDSHLHLWKKKLAQPLPIFQRKANRRLPQKESTSASIEIHFSHEETQSIREQAKRWGTSINILLLGVYAEVLCSVSDQEELLIQVPVANRPKGSEKTLGCFVENLLLRVSKITDNPKMAITALHATLRESIQNLIPLPLLLQKIVLPESTKNQLHRVVLNWGQVASFLDIFKKPIGDLTLVPVTKQSETTQIDLPDYAYSVLNINVLPAGDILGLWQYNRQVFHPAEMKRLVHHYRSTLLSLGHPKTKDTTSPLLFDQPLPSHRPFSSKTILGGE